jgi:hypothetical protein
MAWQKIANAMASAMAKRWQQSMAHSTKRPQLGSFIALRSVTREAAP